MKQAHLRSSKCMMHFLNILTHFQSYSASHWSIWWELMRGMRTSHLLCARADLDTTTSTIPPQSSRLWWQRLLGQNTVPKGCGSKTSFLGINRISDHLPRRSFMYALSPWKQHRSHTTRYGIRTWRASIIPMFPSNNCGLREWPPRIQKLRKFNKVRQTTIYEGRRWGVDEGRIGILKNGVVF